MTWTNWDGTKFEDGDILTETNVVTYIGDNLMSLAHPLDVTTGDLDVVSTTSETTFYSVTVPGNSIGTLGEVYMEIIGDVRGTLSSTSNLTTRIKFGGGTINNYTTDYINITTRLAYVLRIRLINQGATNAQLLHVEATTLGAPPPMLATLPSTAAVDTTVDQSLLVSVQWGTSAATNSVRRLSARTLLARN